MKRILQTVLAIVLIFLSIRVTNAQTVIYLPVILSENERETMDYPILSISNGIDTINFLDPGSGIKLANPYWTPKTAQLKDGGVFVNPSNADGQALVAANYDNVVETIPLLITGPEGSKTIERARKLFQMSVNSQNYYTTSFEQNQIYFAVKPKSDKFVTGYAAVYTMSIGELSNPFGAPFVNDIDQSAIENVNLIINREPFFSPLPPCEQIGPLYNVVRNSDFELWNFGIADSEPDSWSDWENNTTGTNNRSTTKKYGDYSLNVNVTGSTGAGYKGVQQTITDYPVSLKHFTIVAHIQARDLINANAVIKINDGVTDVYFYQSSKDETFLLVADYFQHTAQTTLTIQVGIETLGAGGSGNVYIDSLMLLDGDFEQYAKDNLLAYVNTSLIVNHWDNTDTWTIEAGDINWVDIYNVPGDVQAKSTIQVINNTEPPDFNSVAENVGEIWTGLRKRGDVLNFNNYLNFSGTVDTDCQSDSKLVTSVTSAWQQIGTFTIDGKDNVNNFTGKYRLLIRARDRKTSPSDLQFRVRYYAGTQGPTDVIFEPNVTVRGDSIWEVLELTTDNHLIEYDTSFTKIGYIIEVKRTTGTDNAEFDYSVLIPTEEYVKLDSNIPITLKLGLNISNTCKENISIQQILTNNYWSPVYQSSYNIYSVNIYRGILLFSLNPAPYGFLAYDGIDFNLYETNSTSQSTQLSVDNNILYYVILAGWIYKIDQPITDDVDVLVTNGVYPSGTTFIRGGITVYNNNVYLGGWGFNVGVMDWVNEIVKIDNNGNKTTLYSVVTTGLGIPPDINQVFRITNNLYASNLKLNLDTGVVTTVASASRIPLGVFNNNVIYGENGSPRIDMYNGHTYFSNILTMDNALSLSNIYYVYPMTILNETLYIIDGAGVLYSTIDLINWKTVSESPITTIGIVGYNNALYAVSSDSKTIYKLIDIEGEYNPQNYTGQSFLLNNRKVSGDEKRQRLFSVQNRFNGSNVVDDKMIIGVGYKPQYFSLINKELP